ncbi:PIG-L family deacetylase [Angustibacter peucedani]
MGTNRRLMVVVAHPDDDAYGMSGTIALHGDDPGFRFVLVHATDGGAGDIAPGFPATRETLGSVRRVECENAWRAQGRVPDRHVWLDLDDGHVVDEPFDALVDRLAALMVEEQPDVVGTFGPDGITGHPDHITIGAAADAAFHRCREAGLAGFRRLVHGAMPQSVFERWNGVRSRQGLAPWDPEAVYHLRGVPDDELGITVDCSAVAERIVAGLREHRSQLHVITDDPDDTRVWSRRVSREHYVLAWPPREPGTPRLTDVFDDL